MMSGSTEAARMAAALQQKHEVAEAKSLALDETIKAQNAKDFYQLSLWREVRQFLETHKKKQP